MFGFFSFVPLFLFLCGQAWAQQGAPSIHVVAVRGECVREAPVAIINGRLTVLRSGPPPGSAPAPASRETILSRFTDDGAARDLVVAEMKKNRSVRVADRIEDANAVFFVCSSYLGDLTQMSIQINTTAINDSYRVGVQAAFMPAADFTLRSEAYGDLRRSAPWKMDTAEDRDLQRARDRANPGGIVDIGGGLTIIAGRGWAAEISPAATVKQFFRESKELLVQAGAWPRPVKPEAHEAPRPVLLAGRESAAATADKQDQKADERTDTDQATVRIDTSLVLVPVSVLDRDGKYIPDLNVGNFTIYEDGIKQEISDFGATESPFHVALLLDMSGSTRFRVEDIQDAALAFVEQLRPQDRVCVIAFDSEVRIAAEFTNDRMLLTRAILRTRTGGATRVYDALDLVLTERLSGIDGRKAIVIFSDGVDTASRIAKREDVLAHVEESGALVYAVRYDTLQEVEGRVLAVVPPGVVPLLDPASRRLFSPEQLRQDYAEAAQYLEALARRSGARYYDVDTLVDVKQAFTGIAEELRRQYWLGYYPSNQAQDGVYRKIRVSVDRSDAAVRARDGYRTQGGQRKQ
ncbi:MAG: VWA domain-containing protein [Acidobacteria bacterium]|nr:VWA domain-containing protein [Acidobacteriota bacterium]MCW5969820.1 VWA domain-containing protein [Blastocatellales bacterium]